MNVLVRRIDRRVKIGVLTLSVILVVAIAVKPINNSSVAQPLTVGAKGTRYLITPQFDSDRLNSRMLLSGTFHLNLSDSLAKLIPIIRRQFRPNPNPDAVAHGNAVHVPVGWAFVELVNATNQTQALVLSMPHYRCNQATLFVGRGSRFDLVGTVRTSTPLGTRFFPSLNLAFPVSLPPYAASAATH